MLEALRKNNPGLPLFSVTDPQFSEFGTVININTKEIVNAAKTIEMPEKGVSYTASVSVLERCAVSEYLSEEAFGQMPIQIGYCRGYGNQLNAMEWHRCSEINIAVTPLVLLLGRRSDIINGRLDSSNVIGFLLQPGQAVEVYATSLHYCPCQVEKSGFGCIVVLPVSTNLPLEHPSSDPMLRARNKWLIAHEENETMIKNGACPGIYGENYTLTGI